MRGQFDFSNPPSTLKCGLDKIYSHPKTFIQLFVKLFSILTPKQLIFKQKQIFCMLNFLISKINNDHQYQQSTSSTSPSNATATILSSDQHETHKSPPNINSFQISQNRNNHNHHDFKNLEQDFLTLINFVLALFDQFPQELQINQAKRLLLILKPLIGKYQNSKIIQEMVANQKERIENAMNKHFSQLKEYLQQKIEQKGQKCQPLVSNLNYKMSNLLIFTQLNKHKNIHPFYIQNQTISFSLPSNFNHLTSFAFPQSQSLSSKNNKKSHAFSLPVQYLITSITTSQFQQINPKQSNKKLKQKICRILNKGKGQIYIGIKYSEKDNQKSNTEMQTPSWQCKNFIIEGVSLKMSTGQHKQQLMEMIEVCLCKNVKNLNPTWNKLIDKILVECFTIEYIPVFEKSFIQNFKKDELIGTFVIKVKINFTKYSSQQLFYLDQQSKPDPIFFTQTPSMRFNQHNHLIASKLYHQILSKYRSNKNLTFQQSSQNMSFGLAEQIINQTDQYLNLSSLLKSSHQVPEQQKEKENLKQKTIKASSEQESNRNIFGRTPSKSFNYCAVLLIKKEQVKQHKFHLKMEALLKQRKLAFQLYIPYEGLKQTKIAQRFGFFLNHQKKHDIVKSLISSQLDSENRIVSYHDVRNQLQLIKSIHFKDALKIIQEYFSQRYPTGMVFKTAIKQIKQKDNTYFFKFNGWEPAVFAFLVLENKCIKTNFVNLKKLQNSDIVEEHSVGGNSL